MSRSYKFGIWLAGIIALLGVAYACLPMILEGVVKHSLSARGLQNVVVSIGYPGWRKLRLHTLQFTVSAGKQHIASQFTNTEVKFHLTELLTGRVRQIRISNAVVQIHPDPDHKSSDTTMAILPLAAFLSGQWLSQLPAQEILLEQLDLDWHAPSDMSYRIKLSCTIRDAKAEATGEIHLPLPKQKLLAFSLVANKTGKSQLTFFTAPNSTVPIFDLAINNVSVEPQRIQIKGVLSTKLESTIPVLMPKLNFADWLSKLNGDLNTQWHAEITENDWQVAGEARIDALKSHWHNQALPSGELTARFEADSQGIAMQTILRSTDNVVMIKADGLHEFTSGRGHADLKLMPVVFSESGVVLSQLARDWPYSFDITHGRVSGHASLDWQDTIDLYGILRLDKLDGHYKHVAFAGLSGDLPMKLVNSKGESLRTSKETLLQLDVVDIGFPVENIAVRFTLVPRLKTMKPLVRVQQFSANLLGGQAHSGPFVLDFGREKNTFVVQFEQIGLNNILQLEQQQGLAGSGVLDGQIPVEISSKGIVVHDGQLSARAPGGNIHYMPTEKVLMLAESNSSVKMVVDALSNFQYHLLDIKSDYRPGGDLTLQIRLKGKNPDWQAGQPVHLNLSIEENIPALLRSLQLSGEITEQVRGRYKKAP